MLAIGTDLNGMWTGPALILVSFVIGTIGALLMPRYKALGRAIGIFIGMLIDMIAGLGF